jgi:hypothetical protein
MCIHQMCHFQSPKFSLRNMHSPNAHSTSISSNPSPRFTIINCEQQKNAPLLIALTTGGSKFDENTYIFSPTFSHPIFLICSLLCAALALPTASHPGFLTHASKENYASQFTILLSSYTVHGGNVSTPMETTHVNANAPAKSE